MGCRHHFRGPERGGERERETEREREREREEKRERERQRRGLKPTYRPRRGLKPKLKHKSRRVLPCPSQKKPLICSTSTTTATRSTFEIEDPSLGPEPWATARSIFRPRRSPCKIVRAGFRLDSNRESLNIRPPAGLRPAGGPIGRLVRLESSRNRARTDLH